MPVCLEYEIPQMKATAMDMGDYSPKFTFVVVQKRINTRLFSMDHSGELTNPRPGTILDREITKRNQYDFYLVSQNVRQGIVSPTHYVVIKDEAQFLPDYHYRNYHTKCAFCITIGLDRWPHQRAVSMPINWRT